MSRRNVQEEGRRREVSPPTPALSQKGRRCRFPLPDGERVRVRGGQLMEFILTPALSQKGRRCRFPLPDGERARVRGGQLMEFTLTLAFLFL